jgi:hypothetical protein
MGINLKIKYKDHWSCQVLQIQVIIIFKEVNLILFCLFNLKTRNQKLPRTFFLVLKIYFGLEINNNIFKKLNTQLQTFKANITKKQRSIIGQNNLKMKKKKAKYLY